MVLAIVLASGYPRQAEAQQAQALEVDTTVDGAITSVALVGTLLLMQLPVDSSKQWKSEIFLSVDKSVQKNFSPAAADLSDVFLATTVAAPLLLQVSGGFDESAGRSALVYGETLATSLLVNSAAKYLVQRPRPYVYNKSARAGAYAAKQGDDAYLSFYSGHASMSFAAAVAGSSLFALESDSQAAKSSMWGLEIGLASATAILRVRAGKHYYSDVALGLLIGSAMGVLVPALHSDEGAYRPSGSEWGAIAAGLGVGALLGRWMPLPDDDELPSTRTSILRSLQLSPMGHGDGAGVAVSASF